MTYKSTYPILLLSIILSSLLVSHSVYALSSDRDQPADIEADDTEFNFKSGVRTFIGNVIVIQGTLRVKADKVVANYKDGTLQNATAWGKPARFKQRPDGKPDDVEGNAKKLFINSVANTLTLTGGSSLKQGAQTIRGENIIYNMATDTLKVKGGNRGTRLSTGGNTRKLEDPFKDDPLPAAPTPKPAKQQSSNDMDADRESNKATVENEEPPLPVGRSRLIIQPKKKTEEEQED